MPGPYRHGCRPRSVVDAVLLFRVDAAPVGGVAQGRPRRLSLERRKPLHLLPGQPEGGGEADCMEGEVKEFVG